MIWVTPILGNLQMWSALNLGIQVPFLSSFRGKDPPAQLVIQLALLYIHEIQAWYNLLIIDIPQLRGLKTYLNR
jgi:hypothetical protein